MFEFAEFMMNVLLYTNVTIVNDLNIDCECVTTFITTALLAKFTAYNLSQLCHRGLLCYMLEDSRRLFLTSFTMETYFSKQCFPVHQMTTMIPML